MTVSAVSRLLRDRRGVSAVTVAIIFPVMIGFAGLGVDTGMWYTIKRQNQSAVDAAAISAAYELLAGKTDVANDLTPAASEAAARNGYAGNAPTVIYPYSDSIVGNGVKVTLQQNQSPWFSSWFLPSSSVTIANQAVATVKPTNNNACVLTLGTGTGLTGSPTGIGLTGNYSVTMPNCALVADSPIAAAIDGVGNGCITALTIVSAGEYSFSGNSYPCQSNGYSLTLPPTLGGPNIANPYAGIYTHTFLTANMPTSPACTPTMPEFGIYAYSGNCVITGGFPVFWKSINLSGGTQIAGGLSLTGSPVGTINLSPGTYWITDGSLTLNGNITLQCPSCALEGPGVTLIFTTTKGSVGTIGTISASADVNIDLNAPASGSYSGLLMAQDTLPGASYASSFSCLVVPGGCMSGNSSSTLSGLIYFPSSQLNFLGNIQTVSNCLVIVAKSVTLTGNAGLSSSGCQTAGLTTVPTLNTVALAE